MVKINFNNKFDANQYYKKVSQKYYFISKNEILKKYIEYPKDKISTEEIFDYLKSNNIGNFNEYFKGIEFKCLIWEC